MRVIFNADDFAVGKGINQGITDAYLQGILTSTSIRTNGVYYEDAVRLLKTDLQGLGVGLHINLTDGKSQTKNLALSDGTYKYSFLSYLINSQKKENYLLKNIEEEIEQQLHKAKRSGLYIDHVDSEEHVHMIPEIFKIICRSCKNYGIKAIRFTSEPLHFISSRHSFKQIENISQIKWGLLRSFAYLDRQTLLKEGLLTTDAYYGILYTNHMDEEALISILKHAKQHNFKIIEIASHPALPKENFAPYTSKKFEKYASLENRKIELQGLLSNKVKKFIKEYNIQLANFKEI
jgi:predicted glycoside hydrolase/deacetylase ChbG (UPF0249 family)